MGNVRALSWVGGLVCAVGVAAGLLGVVLFSGAFMTPSATFFAHPLETMDAIRRDSFLGIVFMAAAGGLVPLGGILLSIGLALSAAKPSSSVARFARP